MHCFCLATSHIIWRFYCKKAGCSETNPCFVVPYEDTLPGERLSLGYASACTSIISGLHHLYAFVYSDRYLEFVKSSVVVPRWIDYGFSSPLMFLIVSVLWSAPPDLRDIVFGFSIQFLVILGGYGSEIANRYKQTLDKWALFAGASLAYSATWAYLFVVFRYAEADMGHPVCGSDTINPAYAESDKDTPDFVYAILFGIFAIFSCFAFVHFAKIWKGNPDSFESNLWYEAWYSVLSFTSKFVLLGLLTSGVIGRSDGSVQLDRDLAFNATTTGTDDGDDDVDWGVYGTLIGTIGFSGILGAVFFWMFRKGRKQGGAGVKQGDGSFFNKLVF